MKNLLDEMKNASARVGFTNSFRGSTFVWHKKRISHLWKKNQNKTNNLSWYDGTNAKEGSDIFNMQIETKAVYASINVYGVSVWAMMNARRQRKHLKKKI
jgi:hypothetical protein